jgi:hypothetical protein
MNLIPIYEYAPCLLLLRLPAPPKRNIAVDILDPRSVKIQHKFHQSLLLAISCHFPWNTTLYAFLSTDRFLLLNYSTILRKA